LTVKEALGSLSFWLLSSGITLRILVTMGLMIHFVPILVWKGMDEVTSAYLVSLFAFANIITMLTMGWVGDRCNKALLCSAGILSTVVAMLALVFGQGTATLYAFPVGLALTMGTNPLNWALIGDLFGRRSYATLRGIMGIGYGTGTFLSPIYAGWVFDKTGSYTIVLFTFSFILLIAACCFYSLRHRSPGKGFLKTHDA
jgi:MFS family permease